MYNYLSKYMSLAIVWTHKSLSFLKCRFLFIINMYIRIYFYICKKHVSLQRLMNTNKNIIYMLLCLCHFIYKITCRMSTHKIHILCKNSYMSCLLSFNLYSFNITIFLCVKFKWKYPFRIQHWIINWYGNFSFVCICIISWFWF